MQISLLHYTGRILSANEILFSLISEGHTNVANGELTQGIPWETKLNHKKFNLEPVETIPFAFWAGK